ncbi:MAG: hypothetical protein Q7S57_05530 [bacterium]|nr:hypothetical protein [bacterium]
MKFQIPKTSSLRLPAVALAKAGANLLNFRIENITILSRGGDRV